MDSYTPQNIDDIKAIEYRIKGIRQANKTAYNRNNSAGKANPDTNTISYLSTEYMNAIQDLDAERFKAIQIAIDEAYEILKSGGSPQKALIIMKWISQASRDFSSAPVKVRYNN